MIYLKSVLAGMMSSVIGGLLTTIVFVAMTLSHLSQVQSVSYAPVFLARSGAISVFLIFFLLGFMVEFRRVSTFKNGRR
jgi:hypothetical protein